MEDQFSVDRRTFIKWSGAIGSGLLLGNPALWAANNDKKEPPATNLEEALRVGKHTYSLPGYAPGRVVEVIEENAIKEQVVDADVVNDMVERGLMRLTGLSLKKSFKTLFKKDDVIGIKVNPVGPRIISTHLEVVDAVIRFLRHHGVPTRNIIIWDRFDYMLSDAGFTAERFPGVGIEGLQTMDEAAAEGLSTDNSKWLDAKGHHLSLPNFDKSAFYWVDVTGPEDEAYLNQHVVNGNYSYFGKLLTQKLTKIINLPVFKNTGNGISMATKNLGYGSICNTGRLHTPLFFNVCTEVLAFPYIRDKLVLNITDALIGQYDGGPSGDAKFTYEKRSLFFATDPFALDMICHNQMVAKRKEMNVRVNEHPRYTEYLRYAEQLGLGIVDPDKIEFIKLQG
ncbi:DUF362 domain-containing protein [candidate division KSB1 bacterium]|nr:DUF362 domain-containing protein [candidate division KSB1 bacterium]